MSGFKDAVQADIKRVFLNRLEFADIHRINGKEILASVDRDVVKERPNIRGGDPVEGVFLEEILVYVAAADMDRVPVKGELFSLDDERFLVAEVGENMGILEITITANEA